MFRGGWLEKAAPGEELAKYICLDLSAGWGLSNRLQTMVLFMIYCNRHRYGLYILWEPNSACPGTFLEVAAEVGEDYDEDDSPSIGATPRPSSTPESKPRYGVSDPGEEPHYKKPKVAPTRVPKSAPSSSTDQMSWR